MAIITINGTKYIKAKKKYKKVRRIKNDKNLLLKFGNAWNKYIGNHYFITVVETTTHDVLLNRTYDGYKSYYEDLIYIRQHFEI